MQGRQSLRDVELVLEAAAMGREGFSKAAEVVAPLLAAEKASKSVEEHYLTGPYNQPFGFRCPSASRLGEVDGVEVPFYELARTSKAAELYGTKLAGEGLAGEAFVVSVGKLYSYYIVAALRVLARARSYVVTHYRKSRVFDALNLGMPSGHKILLRLADTRNNIRSVLRLSAREGLSPYTFIDLYVDLAKAAGGSIYLEALARAAEVAAMATRAALREAERLSRIAADSWAPPAIAEVSEEIRHTVLTAYYRATEPMDSTPAGRQAPGDARDIKILGEVLWAYRHLIRTAGTAITPSTGVEEEARRVLDELVNNTVYSAAVSRAVLETLASLSEPY